MSDDLIRSMGAQWTSMDAALAAIPGKHAQPDPSTLATLPKGGAQLSYMGHAEVTLALIDVDPLWTWEPLAMNERGPVINEVGKRLVMWARLTVCGKSIIGVGTCDAHKGDPEKELIGDFLRNAAMRFGIGTKLWSKAIDADPAGRSDAPQARKQAASPASQGLWERIKATKGTPVADELKAFAAEAGMEITAQTIAADPKFAAQLQAILEGDK